MFSFVHLHFTGRRFRQCIFAFVDWTIWSKTQSSRWLSVIGLVLSHFVRLPKISDASDMWTTRTSQTRHQVNTSASRIWHESCSRKIDHSYCQTELTYWIDGNELLPKQTSFVSMVFIWDKIEKIERNLFYFLTIGSIHDFWCTLSSNRQNFTEFACNGDRCNIIVY